MVVNVRLHIAGQELNGGAKAGHLGHEGLLHLAAQAAARLSDQSGGMCMCMYKKLRWPERLELRWSKRTVGWANLAKVW
jgi:hypothetical protein